METSIKIPLPKKKSIVSLLARCYRSLAPYWKIAGGAYLALLGSSTLNILIPQVLRWIIDRGIRQGQTTLLVWAALSLLGLTLVRGVLAFLEGRWSEIASQNVAYDLRSRLQHKLTILPFSFHDQSEAGDLLARAVQDVERIRFLTGRASMRIVEAALVLTGVSGMLLWMNLRLGLQALLIAPFLVLAAIEFGRRYRPLSLEIQKQLGVLTSAVEQNLRGAQVVRAFAQEQAEIARFEVENERWFRASAYANRLQSFNQPRLFLIANLGMALVIWAGGRQVIAGTLTLGEMVAFTSYLGLLVDPVRRLGMIIPAMIIAASASERVFEILDTVPDVKDAPRARALPPVRGEVRFEHVSFAYGARKVLVEVDFTAQAGQMVALLGPTGSGKSSIVNLVPRFYDPTAGRVLVDGLDIRSVMLKSLRSQIGTVLQETVLFSGSIRENLLFGCKDCREQDLYAAAQAAQADEFIRAMPDGYDTRVGERGATLSGGQKQRLAIARAMLMNPRILILDDATAAVDTGTEQLIQQALYRLMHGRTTFVIAHRLSTVMRADLILVLDHGRIAARGTHAELQAGSPLYAEICARQLRPENGPSAGEAAA